jgi:hypothetical protein
LKHQVNIDAGLSGQSPPIDAATERRKHFDLAQAVEQMQAELLQFTGREEMRGALAQVVGQHAREGRVRHGRPVSSLLGRLRYADSPA